MGDTVITGKLKTPENGKTVVVFNELSTGAADDIAKATNIARDMVVRYGMDEGLGCVAYAQTQPRFLDVPGAPTLNDVETSPQTAQRIDGAVRGIVYSAFERATAILRDNRAVLDRTARTLLAKETLEERDIVELTDDLKRST